MKTDTSKPTWLTLKGANADSGLSPRLLQNLIRDNLVVSSVVKLPGASKGRRLIKRESLDAFIEKGIGGYCDIAPNAKLEATAGKEEGI